eukprot:GHVP01059687.1.p1 GENE.GHVP01059687.1~~GHVP01059687.1.p1  ORF type:complete len:219 (+),score=31.49 GHVP01059687.1:1216-1872(+)
MRINFKFSLILCVASQTKLTPLDEGSKLCVNFHSSNAPYFMRVFPKCSEKSSKVELQFNCYGNVFKIEVDTDDPNCSGCAKELSQTKFLFGDKEAQSCEAYVSAAAAKDPPCSTQEFIYDNSADMFLPTARTTEVKVEFLKNGIKKGEANFSLKEEAGEILGSKRPKTAGLKPRIKHSLLITTPSRKPSSIAAAKRRDPAPRAPPKKVARRPPAAKKK